MAIMSSQRISNPRLQSRPEHISRRMPNPSRLAIVSAHSIKAEALAGHVLNHNVSGDREN